MPRRGLPLIVAVGVFVVILGVLGEMIAAFGYRFSVWNLTVAFHIVDIAAWVCAFGGLLSLLAALATRPGTNRRGFALSILGVILAIAAVGSVIRYRTQATSAAPVHDAVTLPIAPGAAFHVALAAARDMGWAIVAVDSAGGRIQATSTSTWFGFKDDIVVRIGDDPKGSRVDVESDPRAGQSDNGTNAARVQSYERRLTARV